MVLSNSGTFDAVSVNLATFSHLHMCMLIMSLTLEACGRYWCLIMHYCHYLCVTMKMRWIDLFLRSLYKRYCHICIVILTRKKNFGCRKVSTVQNILWLAFMKVLKVIHLMHLRAFQVYRRIGGWHELRPYVWPQISALSQLRFFFLK